MDIATFETANDLHDRVYFADVTEELVAEAFAGTRAFHEPGGVDEVNRGRGAFRRMRKLRKHLKARVGHGYDAEIGIDRAKRIVRGLRFSGAGDGVEKGGFSNVRQTYYPGA